MPAHSAWDKPLHFYILIENKASPTIEVHVSRNHRIRWGFLQRLVYASVFFTAAASSAIQLPAGFSQTTYVDNFPHGTTMTFAPDGRLFVCAQSGGVFVVKDGAVPEKPLFAVDADEQGEHGLNGLAFDPDFAHNGYIYVYYTAKTPSIHHRISRFRLENDVAGPESIIWEMDPVGTSIFHMGGMLRFGPDGKLYVGPGDNGGYPFVDNAQRLTNLFGKILRLNPDGTIPGDNPLLAVTTGKQQAIWAYGLRNAYSFDFHPRTGRMLIGDVGGTEWEEINEGLAGHNYGWPTAEGPSTDPKFTAPLHAYHHGPVTSDTEGCAISSGAIYAPAKGQFPASYQDQYFFIDYCNNWLHVMDPKTHAVSSFGKGLAANPTILRVGPDGALYYMSRWEEGIYRIAFTGRSK
jgi:glucose/arabinose dehydrogenase